MRRQRDSAQGLNAKRSTGLQVEFLYRKEENEQSIETLAPGTKLGIRSAPVERSMLASAPIVNRMSPLPRTFFACFVAFLPSGCRSVDKTQVQAEPAPSARAESVAPVLSGAAPIASLSAAEVSPAASASASASAFAVAESSADAPPKMRPKPPPPIPLPRVRPLGAQEVAAVLVRSKPNYPVIPEFSTQLIHADGTITTKKGAYVFINGQLHRYQQREKISPNPPCTGEKENPFPKRIWRNAEFVPEKTGKNIEIIPMYKPNPKEEGMVHTEVEHDLVAALPGYVFIKSSITDYGCGAHALYGREFVLVAWGADGSPTRLESSDYSEGTDVWIEHAVAKFNAQVDPAESPDSLDGRIQNSEDVKVVMVYPMLTAKGAVWTGLFAAPATWVGSFGGWAGYTRAMPMAMNKIPARFRDAMVTPEPVNDYVAKHEKDEEILGFTVGDASK